MGQREPEHSHESKSNLNRRTFLKQIGVAAAISGLASGVGEAEAVDPGTSHPVGRPNILYLFSDQHRFDWTSRNEAVPLRTPNLDGLASRGVSFQNAYCASPLCGPSRACLASGREYDRCGVPRHGINYPTEQQTVYSQLQESGYHVMTCGKSDLHKATDRPRWGGEVQAFMEACGFSAEIDSAGKWDAVGSGQEPPYDPYVTYLAERGFRDVHVEDMGRRRDEPRLDPGSWGHYKATFPTPLPERAYSDNWIARNGLALIREAPADRPWFLQVNFAGPHEPMDITHRMLTKAEAHGARFPPPHANTQLSQAKHQAIRRNYAAMIENIDRWLGIYLDELERRGELGNTVVVYSSDHGEMLGDHNRWAKSLPYEPSVGVPLVAAGPGVQCGRVSDALVSLVDVAATFVEIAGAEPIDEMDGRSFVPVLSGVTDAHRGFLRSGLYGWRVVRDDRYKLVRGFVPEEGPRRNDGQPAFETAPTLLYDLQEDPRETTNIASQAPERVARLGEALMPA